MFLNEILEHKRLEVSKAIGRKGLRAVIEEAENAPPPRPFLTALRHPHRKIGLIAEIKKASPSVGVIRQDFDYLRIAHDYEAAGADCISVLTDEKFFQGKLSYLTEIRGHVGLPLLRKDFIVDSYQIYEARAACADAILLIVAALDEGRLREFQQLGNELGMAVLVETHSLDEMEVAARIDAELIGINSRNLTTFATDLAIVEKVAAIAPTGSLLVAESAIRTPRDVDRVAAAGASSILVGETLMRAHSIAEEVERLIG